MERSQSFVVSKSSQHFKKKSGHSKCADDTLDDSVDASGTLAHSKMIRTPRSKSSTNGFKAFDSGDADVNNADDEMYESKTRVSLFNSSVKKMINKKGFSKKSSTLITELDHVDNVSEVNTLRVRTPVREWAENFLNDIDSELAEDDKRENKPSVDVSDKFDTGHDTDLEDEDERDEIRRLSGAGTYIDECQKVGAIPVSYFIRHIEDREFVMKHHGLGPNGTKAMSTPLEWNTTIERINLEGNDIREDGAMHLCTMLKENLYISDLIIPENSIGSDGVERLLRLLCDNNTINKLDISGNEMHDRVGEGLSAMLDANSTLRFLYLRNNHIGERTIVAMKTALGNNESLELLDLAWNHIRGTGALALADGLAENIGLKYLNVSMNGFAEEGTKAIGKALIANRCLKELDLSWNRIPFEGAMGLAKGTMVNEDLKVLRVGNNPLEASGAFTLLQSINVNENSGIEYLDLVEVFVSAPFLDLKFKLEEKKPNLEIVHGPITRERLGAAHIVQYDFEAAFERDPMTILKRYAQANGLRLIDLFRQFDKDNSMSVSKEEFVLGVQSAGIELNDQQIDRLMIKLDKDGDGEIDYGELLDGDKKNKETQRLLRTVKDDNQRKQEEAENNPLLQTTVLKRDISELDDYVAKSHDNDIVTSLSLNS